MSDSVRPHRRQPTRLPHPWDSPAKNTGVGCHFLLQCMKVKSEREFAQSCPTLRNPMDCSLPSSSVHGIFQARVLEWGAIAFSHITPTPTKKLNCWKFFPPICLSVPYYTSLSFLKRPILFYSLNIFPFEPTPESLVIDFFPSLFRIRKSSAFKT